MIQPTEVRIANVKDFLNDVAPSLLHRVVPISDPFGPAIEDENIQLIVVSEETRRGAAKINEIRQGKNYPPLSIHVIPIFEETARESEHEEDKISSSSKRLRLLGQRLQPPVNNSRWPSFEHLKFSIVSAQSTFFALHHWPHRWNCKWEVKHMQVPGRDSSYSKYRL